MRKRAFILMMILLVAGCSGDDGGDNGTSGDGGEGRQLAVQACQAVAERRADINDSSQARLLMDRAAELGSRAGDADPQWATLSATIGTWRDASAGLDEALANSDVDGIGSSIDDLSAAGDAIEKQCAELGVELPAVQREN